MKKNTENTKQTSNEIYALLSVVYNDILNTFTSKDNYREWMKKPFIIGDYAYSTGAHFLVKIPKKNINGGFYEIPDKKKENVISIIPTETELNFKININKLKEISNKIPLVDEYENTDQEGKCNECDGDGEVEWEYEGYTSYHACPVCDGNGTLSIKKRIKTGKKVKAENSYIDILDCRFQVRFIDTIIEIAEKLEVNEITLIHQDIRYQKNMFKIKDIELLVMAVVKSDDQVCTFHYA